MYVYALAVKVRSSTLLLYTYMCITANATLLSSRYVLLVLFAVSQFVTLSITEFSSLIYVSSRPKNVNLPRTESELRQRELCKYQVERIR